MRLPTTRVGRLAVAVALALGVALAVTELVPALPTQDLQIQVDLKASSGSRLALHHNDSGGIPQTRLIQPGERVLYRFDGPSGDLEHARVEIEDATGGELVFYGIRVVDEHDHVLSESTPFHLTFWSAQSLKSRGATQEFYALGATASPAALEAPWVVSAPSRLPGFLDSAVRALKDPNRRLRVSLITLALSAVLLSLLSRRRRPAAAVALIAVPAVVLVFDFVLSHPRGVAPASEALGRSTYLNLSMPTNVRAIWAMYAVGLLIAAVGAVVTTWWWRRSGGRSPRGDEQAPSGARRLLDVVAVVVVAIAAVGYFAPDLSSVLHYATTWTYPPGWDAENILAWNEFSGRGLVPMKDFWYPYGNFWLFHAAMLKGVIALAIYQLVLFAGFWWVFWVVAGRRLVPASAAALGLLAAQPIVYEFARYGLGLLIALAYACIDPHARRIREEPRLVFAALTTLGLFFDPVLVGYAAFGVAALLAVDLAKEWRLGAGWWARRLAADFALPVVGLILVAVVLLARGQLAAFVDLYTSLGLHAVYSAEPTVMMAGLRTAFDLTTMVAWIPAVLFSVGLFIRLVSDRGSSGYMLGSGLIVIGAVALPLLLKHSLRTIAPQLLLFPVVATILLLLWGSLRPSRWYAVGALSGLATAALIGFGGPEHVVDRVRELPGRVYDDARIVLTDREARDQARAARFADARFAAYPEEMKVASALRERPRPRDDTDVYVLGDAPVIYSLLRQRPPWQIVLYDASPLDEQRRVVEWIEEERPRYVVLDRVNSVFDGVPQSIRTPLIFQHVIEHYAFAFRLGAYDVLVRSDKVDPNERYWPAALAGEINLGSIPEVSSYETIEPCARGDHDCGLFLVAQAPGPGWTGHVEIPLRFLRHIVFVRFMSFGEERYTIPVARTWAWGLSHDPKIADGTTKGWRVDLVRGRQPEDILY
jgi:hypothetical protein